jgi:hypothetical protein
MPTSLCSYSTTGKHVALLEHIIMINANQSMLLLHGRHVALLEHIIMINANQYMLLLHG